MLVAAPNRWDEACFAVPAVRALVASGVGVGILCPEEQREFWQSLENLVVLDFPAKAKPKATATDITGNWQASLAWEIGHAAEAFKAAAIPRRLGPAERKLAKQLTHPLNCAAGPLDHRVRHYLAAVDELGIPTAVPDFFAPAMPVSDPTIGPVLLSPDSDFGLNHEWPLDRWEEIATHLLADGRQVMVTGIPGGRDLGQQLAARLAGTADFSPLPPLGDALPFLATHGILVAADSSLPHLASHAGATCVTLFGPNDLAWKRPLGTRHTVVRRHVECAPCLLPKCPMDLRCQNELDVERVWTAIREKLS
jgi:ADP-heptose:LPS heptosyltransferase